MGDAVATESTTDSSPKETGKEGGQAIALPEHLVGEVDETTYTKLPAEAREALSNSVKSLKGAYTRKLQDVAELRRVKEALEADPDKAQYLQRAMAEYDARKAGVKVEAKESAEAKSRLDNLLEEIEPAQRKAVKEFIDGLDERYDGQLKEQKRALQELQETLKGLTSSQRLSRAEVLERDIAQLPGALKTLAVKHKEEILSVGTATRGTRLSVQKLLQIVSDEDDYRKALLATPEQAKSDVERARSTATSRPSGAVTEVETLISKEDVATSRDKRFGPQINLGNVVSKVLRDIKRVT